MAAPNDTSDHNGILLEDINDKLTAILEGQASMVTVPQDVREIKERLTTVESDIKVIKAAVKDQSQGLKEHDTQFAHVHTRLDNLEAA